MTKIAELRDLGPADLELRERELGEELFRLRLQKAMGQEEVAGKLKESRKDLAKIKTLLRELELGGGDAATTVDAAPETSAEPEATESDE
tara:strand:- start:152 stop:421 length:270 start_codon:yes stop_codon:yes gene_type:complete